MALQEALDTGAGRLGRVSLIDCRCIAIKQRCTLSSVIACHIVDLAGIEVNQGSLLPTMVQDGLGEAGSAMGAWTMAKLRVHAVIDSFAFRISSKFFSVRLLQHANEKSSKLMRELDETPQT
jgi:hypothetical protein